jgi:Family of unknown function (DUF5989)
MLELLRDFFRYSRENKKIWIIPFMLLVAGAAGLVVVAESSVVAPFIYSLF